VNLGRVLRVDDLARQAAMSSRTFARQFVRQNGTTPHQWLIHQRVLAAQRLLEKTAHSIDQIAAAVGLESAATLRVHFARVLGISPAAYRRRFSTATTERKRQNEVT
jgi:transcriptional regulator GlxA family with amidase domain